MKDKLHSTSTTQEEEHGEILSLIYNSDITLNDHKFVDDEDVEVEKKDDHITDMEIGEFFQCSGNQKEF
jgi:hypothetical protein